MVSLASYIALEYFLWLRFNTSIYTCLIFVCFSCLILFFFFFSCSTAVKHQANYSWVLFTTRFLSPSSPTPILNYWVYGHEQTVFFGFSLIHTLFHSSDCKLAVVWIRLSQELSEPIWIKLTEPFSASQRSLFEVWKCQLNFYSPAAHFLVLVRTGMLQYQEKLCSFDIFRRNGKRKLEMKDGLMVKETEQGLLR